MDTLSPSRTPAPSTAVGATPGTSATAGGTKRASSWANASEGLSTATSASAGGRPVGGWKPRGTSAAEARDCRNAPRYFGLPKKDSSPSPASASELTPFSGVSGCPASSSPPSVPTSSPTVNMEKRKGRASRKRKKAGFPKGKPAFDVGDGKWRAYAGDQRRGEATGAAGAAAVAGRVLLRALITSSLNSILSLLCSTICTPLRLWPLLSKTRS